MNTLEMMNKASKDGKIYITGSMRFSKNMGFHDSDGLPWDADAFKTLNEVLELNNWKILEAKKMTLSQIESILGYEIELITD